MSKEKKQKLKEYQKNYHEAKKKNIRYTNKIDNELINRLCDFILHYQYHILFHR